MNSLDLVNKLYKPYKITKKGKCTIINSMDGDFVIKPKSNVKEIYSYLDSRNFFNHPKLVDESRSDIDISEYIEDYDYPKEQKLEDMISLVLDMHRKTSYTKKVTEDKYKEIYETLKNNIDYYKYSYNKLIKKIEATRFMSPSNYLFIRNSSKVLNALKYSERTLNNWYINNKEKGEISLSLVHNNLRLEHYLKKDKDYLISFDHAKIDSPILDIYTLYKNEYSNPNINKCIKKYIDNSDISEEDRQLLFAMLSVPDEFKFNDKELESTINIKSKINYLYKVEELIRSYSSKDKIEE